MGQNTSKTSLNSSMETPENLPYSPSESVHSIQDIRKYVSLKNISLIF